MKFIKQILTGCMVLIAMNATCFAMAGAGGPADAAQGAPVEQKPGLGEFIKFVVGGEEIFVKTQSALKSKSLRVMFDVSDYDPTEGIRLPDSISPESIKILFGYNNEAEGYNYYQAGVFDDNKIIWNSDLLDQFENEKLADLIKTAHFLEIDEKRFPPIEIFFEVSKKCFSYKTGDKFIFNDKGSLFAVSYNNYDGLWIKIFDLTANKDEYISTEKINFKVCDETKSVDHFDFSIDGTKLIVWRSDGKVLFDTATGLKIEDLAAEVVQPVGEKPVIPHIHGALLDFIDIKNRSRNLYDDATKITIIRSSMSLNREKFAFAIMKGDIEKKPVNVTSEMNVLERNMLLEQFLLIHLIERVKKTNAMRTFINKIEFNMVKNPKYLEQTSLVEGLPLIIVMEICSFMHPDYQDYLSILKYPLKRYKWANLEKELKLEQEGQRAINERYKDEFKRREMIRQENLRKQQQVDDESEAAKKANQRTPAQIHEAVRPFAKREAADLGAGNQRPLKKDEQVVLPTELQQQSPEERVRASWIARQRELARTQKAEVPE